MTLIRRRALRRPAMIAAITLLSGLSIFGGSSAVAHTGHTASVFRPSTPLALIRFTHQRLAITRSDLRRCRARHRNQRRCSAQRHAVHVARRKLHHERSRYLARIQKVSSRTAPKLTANNQTLEWNTIAGKTRYVISASLPNGSTTYDEVTGTSYTPAAVPGVTVKYAVRTDVARSRWSNKVSIAYPAQTVTSPPPPSPETSSSFNSPESETEEGSTVSQQSPEEGSAVSQPSPEESSVISPPPVPTFDATGTTYYVSPAGSDGNSGTSPESPWRTIKRVNEAPLAPGDAVMFKGGATFSGSTLMPSTSGTAEDPIIFGSYGTGDATLPEGVWFRGHNYLAFTNLTIGPEGNFQGTGTGIYVVSCTIGDDSLAINATGTNSDWTIMDNTINHTGNSGMLLEGDSFVIAGNTITNTGLDTSIPYGKHGIYLKVSNATVIGNTISNFSADGISVRYRNSIVSGNDISDGPIGIAWFQMDSVAGVSHWTGNTITNTSEAGMYVSSPESTTENTIESFEISHNTIQPESGVYMNLHSILGTYTVTENTLL